MARPGVLIIVENLPVPFDRRVWNEATTLAAAGYSVSVICPMARGWTKAYEVIDGIHIYRHPLPFEAKGAAGYVIEYGSALWHELRLAFKVKRERGFHILQACNPPDTIFLIGLLFKLLYRTRFVFDHHDINPELFEAKFGGRGPLYWVVRVLEWLTFKTADFSIATNLSYRQIAVERGGMRPERVFVVRSGPNLERLKQVPADPSLKDGRAFLIGYVGVMGKQEGISYLLRTAKLLRDKGRDDILYRLIGDGPEVAALKDEAKALGVDDIVIFEGSVDDARLLSVLTSADVLVNPDEANPMNDKSTMNKVMEYMAVARPIVQFDLTEGRYSAQEASLYAKPNDVDSFAACIETLLADPDLRQRMGAFGRKRVTEELAWTHEAPKLLAAYDTISHGLKAR
ncbi:MAG: glycosyltransferase WbuB [Alphaproteobacteria bacterium]|nr:MAG: glycosyltransferase WbuB [Alphaproteobacteria bacterium]